MRRPLAAAVALLALTAAAPTAALAHQGNPNMKSVVRALQPHVDGISLQVLSGDDRFQLTNRSNRRRGSITGSCPAEEGQLEQQWQRVEVEPGLPGEPLRPRRR